MKQRRINREELERFAAELRRWERAKGTVKKYCRDIADFVSWLDGRPVTAEAGAAWKACLLDRGLSPVNFAVNITQTEIQFTPMRIYSRISGEGK